MLVTGQLLPNDIMLHMKRYVFFDTFSCFLKKKKKMTTFKEFFKKIERSGFPRLNVGVFFCAFFE